MFKLFVAETNVDSGSVPISWCLDKKVLDKMQEAGCKDPQVVICIVPEGNYHIKKEWRKVVPLKDMIAYIEFRYPGKNKIYGYVSTWSAKRARGDWLTKWRRGYTKQILNVDGDDWAVDFAKSVLSRRDSLSIDVPKECFAKEPPAWEKVWVNHYFLDKCVDQCHYRRRRIFAYGLQPILTFFSVLIRFSLFITALFVGARNIKLWPRVIRPLKYSISDTLDMFEEGTIFIQRDKRTSVEQLLSSGKEDTICLIKRARTIIFMPIIVIPIVCGIYVAGIINVLYGTAIAVVLLTAGLLFAIFVLMITGVIDSPLVFFKKKDTYWYANDDEVMDLICDGTVKTTRVSLLPRKRRSIKLRLSQLKSKVCRPFSG